MNIRSICQRKLVTIDHKDTLPHREGDLAARVREGIASEVSHRPSLARGEGQPVHIPLEYLSWTWQLAQC
jgi:hypothetical protein